MKAQDTYDLLEYIDENGSSYKKDVVRFLKFINQDVYNGIKLYMENLVRTEEKDRYLEEKLSGCRQLHTNLEKFLDASEDSAVTYLTKMIKDNKKEFCDYFFEKAKRFLILIDEGLYEEKDFNPMTLTFNFYVMLKAYDVYCDDFDKYKDFCDTFNFLIEKGSYFFNGQTSYGNVFYSDKKNIIDTLIEMDMFDSFPCSKTYLINLVKNMTRILSRETHIYINCKKNLEYIKSIEEETKEYFDHPMFNKEAYNGVIDGVFNNLEEEQDKMFYSPILSLGDRYQYINSAFGKYIDNKNLFLDVIYSINKFDNGLFDYLNEINKDGKDSFISCMECVFDSDSFYEVKTKLCFILSACVSYSHDNISDALVKIKQMSTNETKKVLLGRVITMETNTVNQIERPVDVYSRACQAYHNAFSSFDSDIKSKIYWSYRSAESFDYLDSVLSSYVEEKKAYYDKEQERKRLEEEKRKQQEKLVQRDEEQVIQTGVDEQPAVIESAIIFDKPKDETGFSKIKSIFTKRG